MKNPIIDVIKFADVEESSLSNRLVSKIKKQGYVYMDTNSLNEHLYCINDLCENSKDKELNNLKKHMDKADCAYIRFIKTT